jgi:flagellar hook-basal body complex protein FliE
MNNITTNLSISSGAMSLERSASQRGESSFQDMLVDSLKQVNTMQHDADQAVESMFTGGDINPAEVLTAVQKADLAFQLTMQLRNKAMDVYREIRDIRI